MWATYSHTIIIYRHHIARRRDGSKAHAEAARLKADVVVTIGGGSLTDGAKVVRIALETKTDEAKALGQHLGSLKSISSSAEMCEGIASKATSPQ